MKPARSFIVWCVPAAAMLLACGDAASPSSVASPDSPASAASAEASAPPSGTDPDAATGGDARWPCTVADGGASGILITALSPGLPGACGVSVMNVTFDLYPAGACTPVRDLHRLDFAGTPLTSTCADLLGLTVGGFYGNVELVDAGYVEDLTPSEVTFEACANAYALLNGCDGG